MACGVSGTLTLYQQDHSPGVGAGTPTLRARLQGPGGDVQYYSEWHTVVPMESTEIRLHCTADAGTEPPPTGYAAVGTWNRDSGFYWTYTGPATYSVGVSTLMDSLTVFQMVDRDSEIPEALSNPCHALHGSMKRAWGSPSYAATANGTIVDDSTADNVLTPVWAADGGGTTDLPVLALTLGVIIAISTLEGEKLASWTNVTYNGIAIDFSGVLIEQNGMRLQGYGGALNLFLLDSSAADDEAITCVVWAPMPIRYRLRGYKWGATAPVQFDIPQHGAVSGPVTGDFEQVVTYTKNSGDATQSRPFEGIKVNVNYPWTGDTDEDVEPVDLRCTIEESDLLMDPDNTWQGFQVLRADHIHIQKPEDLGPTDPLPSAWTAVQQCAVEQEGGGTGLRTTVTLDAGATAGAILRTLAEDYFSYYTSKAVGGGIEEYGLPIAYQLLKHRTGSDIWNWENFGFLVLSYTSELPQALELVVSCYEVTVIDDHMTGSERVANLVVGAVWRTVVYPLVLPAALTSTDFVIDLQSEGAAWLQHVASLELRGFVGQPEITTEFTIEDLVLQQYDPTLEENTGQTLVKIAFARPGSSGYMGTEESGLPISYTAMTLTAEGARSVRPPDQIVTLCEEAGLDFVERITGRVSGIIDDHIWIVQYWATLLNNQEGYTVVDADASPPPWDPTHATYSGAFIDAEDNDMLGGLLCSDFVEQLDGPILTDPTVLPMRPRVGVIYPVAGIEQTCYVDHILDGSLHGLGRQGNGTRAVPGVQVELWEPGGAVVDTSATDHWGGFRFYGAGARENRGACYRRVGGNVVGPWAIFNRIRQWIEPILELTGPPDLARDIYGRVWVAFCAGGHIYCAYQTHHTLGWSERFEVVDAEYAWRDPDILCHLDASVTIRATDQNYTITRTWESRDDGRTWNAVG